jgi:hypothetical protein
VPLCLHRFAVQAEGIALRLARTAPNTSTPPSWSREPLRLACAASHALDINQTTAGRHIGRLAPPIKRAKASARAGPRGQVSIPLV